MDGQQKKGPRHAGPYGSRLAEPELGGEPGPRARFLVRWRRRYFYRAKFPSDEQTPPEIPAVRAEFISLRPNFRQIRIPPTGTPTRRRYSAPVLKLTRRPSVILSGREQG